MRRLKIIHQPEPAHQILTYSLISFGHMEGIPKLGAADLSRRPIAEKILHVPANGYQRTKFQLSSSISLGDMRHSQNKKWELLNHTPLSDKFYTGR